MIVRRKFFGLIIGFTIVQTLHVTSLQGLNTKKYLKRNRKQHLPFLIGWYDEMKNTNVPNQVSTKRIDILMPYIENHGKEKVQEFLDASNKTGVKVLLEIYRPLVESENISEVKKFIRTYKNHPSVYGWYLYDEPEIKKPVPVSPNLLKKVYKAIKEEDKSKPVALVFADIKKIEPYTDAMDIVMWDRYPCEEGVSEFEWVHSYQMTLKKIISFVDAQNKIFWNVLQAYSDKKTKKRLPTKNEFRYMFYSTVLSGANGLLFWIHYLSSHSWNESVLYPAIEELQDYLPAIINGENLSNILQVNNSNIQVNLFTIPNTKQYIIIAINHNHTLINFSIKMNNKLAGKVVTVNKKRVTQISTKASFSSFLNPYDIGLYQIG